MKKGLLVIGMAFLIFSIAFLSWWFFYKEGDDSQELIQTSLKEDGKMQHQLYYEFTPKNEMFYTLLKNHQKNEGEIYSLSETREEETIGDISFRLNSEYHAFYYQKGKDSVSLQSKAGVFQEKGDPKWAMFFDALTQKQTLKQVLRTFAKSATTTTDTVVLKDMKYNRITLKKSGYSVVLFQDVKHGEIQYISYTIPFEKSIGNGVIQGRIALDSNESIQFKKLSTRKHESIYDFLIDTMKKDTE